MADFGSFEAIRAARESLYNELASKEYSNEKRFLLKEAEESLLAQEQLKVYLKGGG